MRNHKTPRLTAEQQEQKLIFCLLMTGVFGALTIWSGLWTVNAFAHGTVSILHTVLFFLGLLFTVTFADITERCTTTDYPSDYERLDPKTCDGLKREWRASHEKETNQ